MTILGSDTKVLLQELYLIAGAQTALNKRGLEMAVDWPKLRTRLEKALVANGVELPK